MPMEDIESRRLSGGVLGEFSGEVDAELLACDVQYRWCRCLVNVDEGSGYVVARQLVECCGGVCLEAGSLLSKLTFRPDEFSPYIIVRPPTS